MKKFITFLFFIASFSSLLLAAEKQETRYVNVQTLEVKDKASNFGKVVVSLNYADAVILLEDNGKWGTISLANGIKGYVNSSSLTKRKIRASGFSASASELALAGKGFNEEIENAYKQSGNVDFDSVDDMEKLRVSNKELQTFIIEGKLNDGQGE